ncbi:hypothetical protein F66182_6860 [Fusarium sp. NRRL 66182]|nr:hypothetical protein F66182_6860 [Fusarium sp. NRRL 66182]
MAKTKSKKRKQNAQAQAQAQAESPRKIAKTSTASIPTPPPDGTQFEPKNLHTVVSEEELEITIDTLTSLAQYPGLIKSKLCKDLRVAVYDFRQACTTGVNNVAGANLTAQVTAALADRRYVQARILLAEMKIRSEQPKLGALCRWVRDLDVISGLSTIPDQQGLVKRSEREEELIRVIDSVLRVCGHADPNLDAVVQPSSIALQEIWDLRPDAPPEQVYASVLDGSLVASAPDSLKNSLRVIETTLGPDRKPPNHHDAILYTSTPDAVPLSTTPPPTAHRLHPTVPGLSVATNVLYPEECKAIIAAGEYVKFLPDAPLREDGDISILAHNFYWVIDQTFHDTLWSRIAPFVPVSVNGRLARGINRRFRVYRYVPGAEYRAHIDGAWPPSGLKQDDTYIYDDSPADRKQSSLFTFLIYLNDEFEGGETTYFMPAAREGILNAYPVRPVMGGAAIFPHGDINAVLHEGTGVRQGAKYVIRTEIEYDVEPTKEMELKHMLLTFNEQKITMHASCRCVEFNVEWLVPTTYNTLMMICVWGLHYRRESDTWSRDQPSSGLTLKAMCPSTLDDMLRSSLSASPKEHSLLSDGTTDRETPIVAVGRGIVFMVLACTLIDRYEMQLAMEDQRRRMVDNAESFRGLVVVGGSVRNVTSLGMVGTVFEGTVVDDGADRGG